MRPLFFTSALMSALLMSLAMAAPSYLADHVAPRSAFLSLPDTSPQPTVEVTATELPSGHWRLTIDAAHFQFTELCLPEAKATPVGHAHIIVNGVKLASAYQPLIDLEPLPPGRHEITVQLRAQDHRVLLGESGLIQTRLILQVPSAFAGV